MLFFGLVYVVEGVGQSGGLIAQPLNYFLKQTYGWSPVQVTAYLTVLNLPWIIKPVYGIVSDFLPLFGYRRKSYLVLANLMAAGAYCWVAQITSPGEIIVALLLSAYGMAISSTVCGAILVENGQKFGATDLFVNQQWLWFNIAAMACAFIGGQLVERLTPAGALHGAAAIIAAAPLLVVFAGGFLIHEEQSRIDLREMKRTSVSLLAALTLRDLWIIAAFLFVYYLNPGLGAPLYYHMTDDLKFSQEYIGILGSINSAGWIAGALLYRRFLKGITAKALLNLSIALGIVATCAFLLLWSEPLAAALERHRNHDRLCRDVEPGRRLLPASLGRLRLCGFDVGHEPYGGPIGKSRLLPVRTILSAPAPAANPGVGRIHRLGVCFRAVAAPRRQAAWGTPPSGQWMTFRLSPGFA
jgi:hypothetical protein